MRTPLLRILGLSLAVIVAGINLRAQEVLMPLTWNLNLMAQPQAKPNPLHKTQTAASDTLPFFDDFSYVYKTPYPGPRWLDSNVYINAGFPVAPISVGVATFDGLNKQGYPYNINAPLASSAGADTLTSRPLNLKRKMGALLGPADSVYLSFYYQARGRGKNSPEPQDSLMLDFYNKTANTWNKVWGIKGYVPTGTDTGFHQVFIWIKDAVYLDSLFQFRFRNRASLCGSHDQWHLDYIYINRNRGILDTSRQDVTIAYPPKGYLKNYRAIPHKQFVASEMGTTLEALVRNNHTATLNASHYYTIRDKNMNTLATFTANGNADPFNSSGYSNDVGIRSLSMGGYTVNIPTTDTTSFIGEHVLLTSASDAVKANDTLREHVVLGNFFAYDDGTAEAGYYLNKNGATAALRFTLHVQDTLQALNIFFNPMANGNPPVTLPQILNSSFSVCVWADAGNGPGTLIRRDSPQYPVYLKNGYNVAPRYPLSSELVLGPGTYYIGIQQTSSLGLNIGFDYNNNHKDALYYDIGSGWKPSDINGSLMINPIFGRAAFATGIEEPSSLARSKAFDLYPNPAQDRLYIRQSGQSEAYTRVEILSSLGQSVLSTTYEKDAAIDVSSLGNGIYFIYLSSSSHAGSTPEKLIISR